MGKKQTDAVPLSLHRLIMGGLVILIVGIGTWLAFEVRHHEDDHIRSELLRQANSVASTLSMENMRDLSFRAEDAELPAYQRISSQLQMYSKTMGIRRLYTLGLREGQLVFGPGGQPSDDAYVTPPGTIHQKPSAADWEAFRTGEPRVAELHSDEFGDFISALVPIVDSLSGEVLLVVGLDMEAAAWREALQQAQLTPLWSTLSIMLLLLLGYIVHEAYKRSPNMRVEMLRNIQVSIYFSVMLLLTVIAFICVDNVERNTQQNLFNAEANSKSRYFAEATEQIDLVLHMMIGFFESSETITREEFSSFCKHIFEGYPIQSCIWLPELSAGDEQAFTARMQTEGFPDFSIRRFAKDNRPEPDPSDPIYPAVYIEPASRLPGTLGYDFYSHPVLRETLAETLRTGSDHACMVRSTAPNNTEPAGFFVFVPISHAQHGGFVCFSLNLDALIKASSFPGDLAEISTTLLELSTGKNPRPLSCSACDPLSCSACEHCDYIFEADLSASAPLFAFGNAYTMLFTAEPAWFSAHTHRGAWWVLAIGLLFTVLLTYTAAVLINRPLLLSKLVIKRTREMAESKERYDIAISAAEMGVWEYNVRTGRFIWNDRMLEIYGVRKDEFDGDYEKWKSYIHPDDHNRFIRELTAGERGEKDLQTEVRIIRADGEIRHIRALGKMIRGDSGKAERMVGVNLDITERKQSQKALEESRLLLCNIIDTLPERVWWKDLDSRFMGCNIHVAHDAGFDHPDQMIGKTDFDMCWAVHAEEFVANDRAVMKSGMPRIYDPERQVMEDGSIRWIEVSMIPLKDTNGKVFGLLCTYADITERMQIEEALRESEERYRQLFDNMTSGFALHEMLYDKSGKPVDYRYLQVNPAFEKLTGLSAETAVGRRVKELMPETEDYWIENFGNVAKTGKAVTLENYSKEVGRFFEARAFSPGQDQFAVVFSDITERKQAELSLARSEAKYRDLFEQSVDAFMIIRDNRIVDCNHATVQMMGYKDKENLLNMHPAELSPERQPDGRLSEEKANEIMQRIPEEKTLRFEWLHKRANGETFTAEVALTYTADSDGSPIIHTIMRDITESKRAKEKLVRLSTAIEQSPESIVITDTNGDIQYINPAFEANTGYTADEAMGQNPRILKSGEHPPSFYEDMWKTLSSGKVWEGRITNKRKNGSLFTEEASIAPVRDVDDCIVNYVAVKRDISGELAQEEELRQAQKMEAIGELAGGVAHDFNNILQGIIGFSELLRYSLDDASQEYKNADEIHKSANQAAKLTQQLLTFSRKQAMRIEEIDLNNVVYDSEALLNVLLGEHHELVMDLSDTLPLAHTDQSQLTQIIMNLAVNARDAMPGGGRLSISTECALINEADAAYIAGARPGRYLCLAVTDTGSGMDAETKTRIFDPFFTTKEIGFGTGLGLAVIYGIVEQNNGWINVYSEVGKGSCFKIYLPAAESNGSEANGDPEAGPPDRKARVLVIDDEQDILKMAKKVLESANFTVMTAESAEEGLALFDQDPGRFDLLMSDMILPGMPGDELAEALRTRDPGLPVLLVSGYRDQATRWRHFAEKGYLFLNKPFTITTLLDTVQTVLIDTEGTNG